MGQTQSSSTVARQEKWDERSNPSAYPKTWHTDLLHAPLASPACFCAGVWCPSCTSYYLRKQALYHDMRRYVCCAGDCPCSGRMGEQNAPELCLAAEVVLCFPQSVASTRWMIQDQMRIGNTACDTCIIGTMIWCQYLACVCHCAACLSGNEELREASQVIDCMAQHIWCTVCGCMMAQHKVQLDLRDAQPGQTPPPWPNQAPVMQQMARPPNGPPAYPAQGPYPVQGPYGPQGPYPPGPYAGPPPGYPSGPAYPPAYPSGPTPGYPGYAYGGPPPPPSYPGAPAGYPPHK